MKTIAILEGYEGLRRFEEELPVHSPDQCEGLISRLDGGSVSALYMERGSDVVLTVAGGPHRFQVSIWDRTTDQGSEAQDMSASGNVSLVIAGQNASLPQKDTLDKKSAIMVLQAFLENGAESPEIVWRDPLRHT